MAALVDVNGQEFDRDPGPEVLEPAEGPGRLVRVVTTVYESDPYDNGDEDFRQLTVKYRPGQVIDRGDWHAGFETK